MSANKRDFNLCQDAADYDSSFDEDSGGDDDERKERRLRRRDLASKGHSEQRQPKASHFQFSEEVAKDEGRRQRFQLLSLNAYDRHKKLINDYFLYFDGATKELKRDITKDRNDLDVVRENHRFLWGDEEEEKLTWGQALAKRYYEKLFKEYCICDLSKYKENKVAMRWRTQDEVKAGKGQFACGSRKCAEAIKLKTWEVNFAYVEEGERKNALVKVRLCPACSYKLNYHHRKKEVKRKKKKEKKRKRLAAAAVASDDEVDAKVKKLKEEENEKRLAKEASEIWSAPMEIEQEKSRDEDFLEYLEDLFL